MATHRLDKVSRLIKEELGSLFIQKLNDPEIGMITITNVKMSPDLRIAKVYISVFDKEKRKSVLQKINDIKSLLRSELAHRVQLRFVPELHFYIDDTMDYVQKMEDLFKKIHKDDNKGND